MRKFKTINQYPSEKNGRHVFIMCVYVIGRIQTCKHNVVSLIRKNYNHSSTSHYIVKL